MLPIVGSQWGGLSDFTVADASVFARAPASVPLAEAATLPLVGLTVMQVLDQAGFVEPAADGAPDAAAQRSALVQAASGGVGTFAVQYLRHVLKFGEVMGTTSSPNAALVTSLGATRTIDYRTEEFEGAAERAGGVDVVLDPMSWKYQGRTLSGASAMLRPGAAYCHILSSDWAENELEGSPLTALGGAWHKWASKLRRTLDRSLPRVFTSPVQPDGARLETLRRHVDAGLVKPVVDARRFEGLESAAEAFEYLETGHAKGKVLIRLADDDAR